MSSQRSSLFSVFMVANCYSLSSRLRLVSTAELPPLFRSPSPTLFSLLLHYSLLFSFFFCASSLSRNTLNRDRPVLENGFQVGDSLREACLAFFCRTRDCLLRQLHTPRQQRRNPRRVLALAQDLVHSQLLAEDGNPIHKRVRRLLPVRPPGRPQQHQHVRLRQARQHLGPPRERGAAEPPVQLVRGTAVLLRLVDAAQRLLVLALPQQALQLLQHRLPRPRPALVRHPRHLRRVRRRPLRRLLQQRRVARQRLHAGQRRGRRQVCILHRPRDAGGQGGGCALQAVVHLCAQVVHRVNVARKERLLVHERRLEQSALDGAERILLRHDQLAGPPPRRVVHRLQLRRDEDLSHTVPLLLRRLRLEQRQPPLPLLRVLLLLLLLWRGRGRLGLGLRRRRGRVALGLLRRCTAGTVCGCRAVHGRRRRRSGGGGVRRRGRRRRRGLLRADGAAEGVEQDAELVLLEAPRAERGARGGLAGGDGGVQLRLPVDPVFADAERGLRPARVVDLLGRVGDEGCVGGRNVRRVACRLRGLGRHFAVGLVLGHPGEVSARALQLAQAVRQRRQRLRHRVVLFAASEERRRRQRRRPADIVVRSRGQRLRRCRLLDRRRRRRDAGAGAGTAARTAGGAGAAGSGAVRLRRGCGGGGGGGGRRNNLSGRRRRRRRRRRRPLGAGGGGARRRRAGAKRGGGGVAEAEG
eukprot:Rhum_TRINITY_DN14641_c5_g1::Rhum_TRINITY_DN14641_c5_g1_i1::g.103148::m.103148